MKLLQYLADNRNYTVAKIHKSKFLHSFIVIIVEVWPKYLKRTPNNFILV